jgi:hypothetical protein
MHIKSSLFVLLKWCFALVQAWEARLDPKMAEEAMTHAEELMPGVMSWE